VTRVVLCKERALSLIAFCRQPCPRSSAVARICTLKDAQPEPGDELAGSWPRKRLLNKMDARFRKRLELAFATGRERRESAAAG
jgi:hypothetical protein